MARHDQEPRPGNLTKDAVISSICNPHACDVTKPCVDCKCAVRRLENRRASELAPDMVKAMAALGVDARVIGDVLIAAKENGIMLQTATLLLSGMLKNPRALISLLRKKVRQNASTIQAGTLREIEIAYEIVKNGNVVELGGQGDIVNHTGKDAIQAKRVSTKDKRTVLLAYRDAEEQLRGKHEHPLPGFKRVVDIYIADPDNPLCRATADQLQGCFENLWRARMPDGTTVVQRIKITITRRDGSGRIETALITVSVS